MPVIELFQNRLPTEGSDYTLISYDEWLVWTTSGGKECNVGLSPTGFSRCEVSVECEF